MRALLLVLPFAFALNYAELVPVWQTAWGSLHAVGAIMLAVAVYCAVFIPVFRGVLATAGAPARARGRQWTLGILVALGLCWNAGRFVEFFPASIDSERNNALQIAQEGLEWGAEGRFLTFLDLRSREYNIGLAPLVMPGVALFGESSLMYKWVCIGFYAVCFGLLATTFTRQNQDARDRWVVLLLAVLAAVLPTLQAYRWHAVCLAGAVVLLRAAAAAWEGKRSCFVVPLAVFCLVLPLYHAQLIYLPAVAGFVAWHLIQPEGGVRRWKRAAALVGFIGLCLALYVVLTRGQIFSPDNRVAKEAGFFSILFEPGKLEDYSYHMLLLPKEFFTWMFIGLFVLGLAVTATRAGQRSADRMALLLFFSAYGLAVILQGGLNTTWGFWYLIPGLWIVASGASGLASGLRSLLGQKTGLAVAMLLISWMGWRESQAYLDLRLYNRSDSPPVQCNTAHQLEYIYRHLSRLKPDATPTLYLVSGNRFSRQPGGFAVENNFKRLDWRERSVEVREFQTEDELLHMIQEVRAGKSPYHRLEVFLSQLGDDKEHHPAVVLPVLAGLPFKTTILELQGAPLPRPMRCFQLTFTLEDGN